VYSELFDNEPWLIFERKDNQFQIIWYTTKYFF
jgi:hypothetical protein